MITGIIGLGLIGGSMAIDLRRRGFARRILGYVNNVENLFLMKIEIEKTFVISLVLLLIIIYKEVIILKKEINIV